MYKIEYLTPAGRELYDSERTKELERKHAEELAREQKLNAERKAEYLRREALWKEALLTKGKSSDAAIAALEESFSTSETRDPQREADLKNAIRIRTDSKFANDLAMRDILEYRRLKTISQDLGR